MLRKNTSFGNCGALWLSRVGQGNKLNIHVTQAFFLYMCMLLMGFEPTFYSQKRVCTITPRHSAFMQKYRLNIIK